MMLVKNVVRSLLFSVFMRNFLRWVIGIRIGDNSSLKTCPQFIVTGNHNSHLDTMAILSSLPARRLKHVYPVAAADYFGRTKLMSLLSRFFINVILIKRSKDGSGPNPIEVMDKALKEGKSIVIFPEGSRGQPEDMQPFKKGIGILLVNHPQIPFIPIYMEGLGKALPRGEGLLVPFEGRVEIGEPTHIQSDWTVDQVVQFVESKVLELKNRSKEV
ncbi:MAG: 1-acyl-sn-glycerol-3-phosphate acyltransferase [Bdellovibrionales bacterium]|nr:1-acyl-sn-glycerol-3-phosphate acyltransferase [Bdellovibrionales bacterium]